MHSESKPTHLYIWFSELNHLIYNPTGPPYFKNRRKGPFFDSRRLLYFKTSVIEEIGLIQVSHFNIMILFKHNCKHSTCVSCLAVKRSNSRLFTVNNEDFVDSVTRYSVLIIRFSSFIRKNIHTYFVQVPHCCETRCLQSENL